MAKQELSARVRSWLLTDVCERRSPETREFFALAGVQVCQGSNELTVVDHVQGGDVSSLADRVTHVLRTYAVPDSRAGTSFALYAITLDNGKARRFAGPWPVRVTAQDIADGELVAVSPVVTPTGPDHAAAAVGPWMQFASYQASQIVSRDATIAERDESSRRLIEAVVASVDATQRACAAIASQASAMVAPLERALATEREARLAAEALVQKQAQLIETALSTADQMAKERDDMREDRAMFLDMVSHVLGVKVPRRSGDEQ